MIEYNRILLAEDDSDDYIFLAEALNKISSSHELIRAANGIECLSLLKKAVELPDLIFLDLNMPIKNGLECLCAIKDNEAFDDIPVIIYSTSHYIKDIDAAYKNDAHYYIVKPADADMLVDVLQVVFNKLSLTLEKPSKETFVIRIGAALES
jgi:CheY-like chemotaxis protein